MAPERGEIRVKRRQVDGIFTSDRVAAMEKISTELGISFERVVSSGEEYPTHRNRLNGKPTTVPQDMEYVIIRCGDRDLADFWRKVDSIAPFPILKTSKK